MPKPPIDRETQSVAPKPRLVAELRRVADSAHNFIAVLQRTNFKDVKFPKQRAIDVARTIIDLPAGSEEGALPALEFAESALTDIRYSSVEIAAGDELPDVPRDGPIDQAFQKLISDISTAKRFYSQSRLDAAARSEMPDHAVATETVQQHEVAQRARAVSRHGSVLAAEVDKSVALTAPNDSDRITGDNLARKTRDVANLVRQEEIEFDAEKPRIAWLEKLDRGVDVGLRGVELAAALGKVAVRKFGEVLIKHVEDWFTGAREWAEESRSVITEMKRKWQAEKGPPRPAARPDRPFHDFSIIRDDFRDKSGRGPELVVIPAGEFLMGSAPNERRLKLDNRASENEIMKVDGRRKGKRVIQIARRFALGRYPVTFEEYDAFLAATAGTRTRGKDEADDHEWGRVRRPVINVSWGNAQAYCDWLNQKIGLAGDSGYRLPSEAEWEYACRAGTETLRWWGDNWDPKKANGDASFEVGGTNPVGSFPANSWGLYDIIGNVWEWCADAYTENTAELPADGAAYSRSWDDDRVLRGGSSIEKPRSLRSAARVDLHPGTSGSVIGFRVARTL
jgi:formylglycine-generating enzyme required for sulfatase activity